MSTDLTFITNEQSNRLRDRFRDLLKISQSFDCLVGYFFISGFHALHSDLEKVEKIRILIGLQTDRTTLELLRTAEAQQKLKLESHAEVRERLPNEVLNELQETTEDAKKESSVRKFIEWIKSNKLEVRAYPSEQIHAKLYIMSFLEGYPDKGRIVTGSSNLTRAGLQDNLEFNVELKNRNDYEFAQKKFDELWANSVDVSKDYVDTVENKSQFAHFTPYELYLKFLYEYFREEINLTSDIDDNSFPEGFKQLLYQTEAVANARKILEVYNGVFLSDVVGLGKTYMAAMLAKQINGRSLVIAPPTLLGRNDPGSWPSIFREFGVIGYRCESLGTLESLVKQDLQKYAMVFIDESHRFRTDNNQTYELLARICVGKKVVLVSASPLNNTPRDILSQLKLFQPAKNSTIPNVRNLEAFIAGLRHNLKGLDRQTDRDAYFGVIKENSRKTREKILKHVMVRRTRTEIEKYYGKDLQAQGFQFPDVMEPKALFYKFNKREEEVFNATIKLLAQTLKYARYTPLVYYTGPRPHQEIQSQRNIATFMKILAVKRLESSFHAFKLTLQRFTKSYERVIAEFDNGRVFISKKDSAKIFELLESDNQEGIDKLIEEERAESLPAKDFRRDFITDLKGDLETLKSISKEWKQIDRDPKWSSFLNTLKEDNLFKKSKLIIFTESQETGAYLAERLRSGLEPKTLSYSGASTKADREKVLNNFDANAKHHLNDYRILVSTDILAEGVNLHRSNVVINYDLPWNPTRLIQRVGRVNRVDTKFKTIHTYNFFPSDEGNDEIKLREAAESKIHGFIHMLGRDSRLLTDGEEIVSHELFANWNSKKAITGEDENEITELQYLTEIRNVRDQEPDLFERIKRLPKKARSTRITSPPLIRETIESQAGTIDNESMISTPALATYFRQGRLDKFFITCSNLEETFELDFMSLAQLLKPADQNETRQAIARDFYDLLERNQTEFVKATTSDVDKEEAVNLGNSNENFILKRLKDKAVKRCPQFTEDDDDFVLKVINLLEEGSLPKIIAKRIAGLLRQEENLPPLKVLAVLRRHIPTEYLKITTGTKQIQPQDSREIILSSLLVDQP